MKVSLTWLQKYFSEPLPPASEVADALTFHSFEIEGQVGDMLDVKVLPDRAAYALSHRGVALEVAASLNVALAHDPLATPVEAFPSTDKLVVTMDPEYVLRHLGALVTGVSVGPSPLWLKTALESVGQRSINNIVDATNYVMLNIGQPMHAFDASKISQEGGTTRITIRRAQEGERVPVLSGETYTLTNAMFVIADESSGQALDIAGLKGGIASGVTESTTDLFVSVGTYDGPTIRKMSQTLKLWTDASLRYQNKISPELGGYGMREVLALIGEIAGGTVAGVVDEYPARTRIHLSPVSVTKKKIENVLGLSLGRDEVVAALGRINLPFIEEGDTFIVSPTFERQDILLEEDVVEEVGRVLGYDRVPSVALPELPTAPDQSAFFGVESIKDFLVERGFVEISTQSFATAGDIELANPLQQDHPWLRASLLSNMHDALAHAVTIAPRILGPESLVKLFEIGSAFTASGEVLVLALGTRTFEGKKERAVDALKEYIATLQQEVLASPLHVSFSLDGESAEIVLSSSVTSGIGADAPRAIRLGVYTPFSVYPFALRDVAVWVPAGTAVSEVSTVLMASAGEHLARLDCFDRFEKGDRISYAFRLVFESKDRTLSDKDLDPAMEQVAEALNARDGFEVR